MEFRVWCTNKWYEHIDEIFECTRANPPYTSKQYFSKYRWWLKREFQREMRNTLG